MCELHELIAKVNKSEPESWYCLTCGNTYGFEEIRYTDDADVRCNVCGSRDTDSAENGKVAVTDGMRAFVLYRGKKVGDGLGMRADGAFAEGVVFSDGTVVICSRSKDQSCLITYHHYSAMPEPTDHQIIWLDDYR